jgi:hypothetical protein
MNCSFICHIYQSMDCGINFYNMQTCRIAGDFYVCVCERERERETKSIYVYHIFDIV